MKQTGLTRKLLHSNIINFSLFFFLSVFIILSFWFYHELDHSQKQRYLSYLAADELRQSSDDLTRMVRTYVMTNDPRYEQMYWDVLAIRNGQKARPIRYENIYWDFMAFNYEKPRPDGRKISLLDMMKELAFTQGEFEKLTEAEIHSNELVQTEMIAMHAMKGQFLDADGKFTKKGPPDHEYARAILYDESYHKAKVDIMTPIDEFFVMVNARTEAKVKRDSIVTYTFIFLVYATIALLLWLSRVELNERKQSEQALAESEERYRQVVEGTDDLITRVDSEGKFTFVNHTAREVFGLEPEECIGLSAFDFIHPEDREKTQEAFEGWIRDKASNITFENRQISKTGQVRHFLWSPKIRFDDSGDIAGFDSLARDITERKQAEESLKASEKRIRTWLAYSPACIKVVDLDLNLQYMSDLGVKELKIDDITEFYGKPYPFDFYPDSFRNTMTKNLEKVRETGEVIEQEALVVDTKGNELWYHSTLAPVNDDEGQIDYIMIVSIEVTERKQIEEELKLESHMRTVLLDNIPNCFAFILKKGTREIVACNQAAKDVGAFPGKTCYQTCAQRDDPCPFCRAPELWDTNDPKQLEVEYMGRYYEGIWVPLSEELYVHYIFDITERKRAEDALRKSEERFKLLYEGSPLGYQSLDAEGNLIEVNPAWLSLLGYDRDEVIGRSFADFLDSGFPELFKERFPCFKAAGEACSVPFVMIRKDGSHVDIEIDGKIGYNPDGSFKQTHCVLHNVTERKRAEEALRSEKDKLQALTDGLGNVGIGVDIVDVNYKILSQNQILMDRFGDLTGKYCYESYMQLAEPCENCPMSKAVASGHIERVELTAIDGRDYEILAAPLPNPDGTVDKAIEVVRDITERKRAEASVKEMALFAELNPAPVLRFDIKGTIISANSATASIFGEKVAVGSTLGEVIPCFADIDLLECILDDKVMKKECRIKGRSYQFVVLGVSKNGTGHIYGSDITERKRTEDALQDKTKEMETLLRAVSHDLRTPLVNIEGFSGELAADCEHLVEMLQNVKADAKTKKEIETLAGKHIPESLSFIRKGTKKMDGLLIGLSHLAKAGTVKLDIQRLDINDIAQQVVDAMKFSAREAGATIELESLPDCIGDEVQINQVFSNLIGNAVKYLDPERAGRIRIWGKVEGDMSQYCVEDNGVGIPDYHKAKVFEIFHRVDPKSSASGDGLGLTTTKQIVERHKGRIWLESEEGKGSKFFISLPHHCD